MKSQRSRDPSIRYRRLVSGEREANGILTGPVSEPRAAW
jgi:hypothetical protein